MKPRVLAVVGPTACGKTEVSLALSYHLPVEIVCMDSMQVYRGMDIGTAKPTLEEQGLVPHHMLDVVEPWEPYSVAAYRAAAAACIDDIVRRGKVPVLVGGTGMYLRALSLPMDYGNTQGDDATRQKYENFAKEKGNDALHLLLQSKDPETAQRLHPNDVRRVVRALEVLDLTGEPLSKQKMPSYEDGPFQVLPFAPLMERETLYNRVNQRVHRMLDMGLEDEVQGLLKKGVPETAQSMQGIGYKELLPLLKGQATREDTIQALSQRTRNYAKRQMTWFRSDQRIVWLQNNRPGEMAAAISHYFLEGTR